MVMQSDSYKIGIFEEYNFRFLLTDITTTMKEVSRRQNLENSSNLLVAKTMIGSFFLAGMVKEETIVSIQLEGDGPVERVMAYSDRIGRMRGLARYSNISVTNDPSDGIGKGVFRVTRWGGIKKLHQSITRLEHTSFESNLIHHISESDQLVSFLTIYAETNGICKGLILQALPFTEQYKIDELKDRIGEINSSTEELFYGTPDIILQKLEKNLHSRALVLDSGIPEFYCGCTIEKIKSVIRSLGIDEAKSILEEQGSIRITCEFCNEVYELDSEDINILFMK